MKYNKLIAEFMGAKGYPKYNPNEWDVYKNRGIAKEKIGDLEGACADWRQTVSLSPNDAAANWVIDQC